MLPRPSSAAGTVRRPGERILDGSRDPEPAPRIEGEVHRLVDVRLGGDELNLETGRKAKCLLLVLGLLPRRGADVFDKRILSASSAKSAEKSQTQNSESAATQ